MYQKDVAALVNATTSTVTNWEKGRTTPRLCLLPKVVEFLGYMPFQSSASSFGEQIKAYRVRNGLSLKKIATFLRVDPDTVARWENEGRVPNRVLLERLKRIGVIGPIEGHRTK
jgi:transcriptional regulator with XRE-family HTH domain